LNSKIKKDVESTTKIVTRALKIYKFKDTKNQLGIQVNKSYDAKSAHMNYKIVTK